MCEQAEHCCTLFPLPGFDSGTSLGPSGKNADKVIQISFKKQGDQMRWCKTYKKSANY